jgi:hypothetical protein
MYVAMRDMMDLNKFLPEIHGHPLNEAFSFISVCW